MKKQTIEWENPTIKFKVHDLVRGDMFSYDGGASWHIFDRFGKSIIPGHIIIVTVEGMTCLVKLLDQVIIK
ncbi:MAG: hypothetical protein WCT07_03540 [Candidatus Paceibacterota bacterium]